MNCRTAESWYGQARTRDELPATVARHLRRCVRCRRRFRRLLHLDAEFRRLPLSADNPAARARILDKLGAQHSSPAPRLLRLSRRQFLALAALLLLTVGLHGLLLWLGRTGPAPRELPGRTDNELVVRFLERGLRLADSAAPAEQLQLFADMASDLRSEALRLAKQQSPDDVPLMASLYQRIVQRGLLGRATALSADEQRKLLPAVQKQLDETHALVAQAKNGAPPAVGDLLRPVGTTAREASAALADLDGAWNPDAMELEPLPASHSPGHALLAVLVVLRGHRQHLAAHLHVRGQVHDLLDRPLADQDMAVLVVFNNDRHSAALEVERQLVDLAK